MSINYANNESLALNSITEFVYSSMYNDSKAPVISESGSYLGTAIDIIALTCSICSSSKLSYA